MRSVMTMLVLTVCAWGVPANDAAAQTLQVQYSGDVHGLSAVATVTLERTGNQNYDGYIVSGEIRSATASYVFTGDYPLGGVCYADLVSLTDGSRFQVEIQFTDGGNVMTLIANPFGPGSPTAYRFTR